MMLKGVSITCNYPDDTCEAAIPSQMTVEQLNHSITRLIAEEKDLTSVVITFAISR